MRIHSNFANILLSAIIDLSIMIFLPFIQIYENNFAQE